MNEMITWNELECNSTNGYGIQIHYSFNSFDKSEIDRVKKWCESHIHAGVKFENQTFREETENMNVLDKIKAEIEEEYGGYDICEWYEDYDYEENDISEYQSIGSISDILEIIDKYKEESEV